MANCCLVTKCTLCCIKTNMILTSHDIEIIEKLGYESPFFVSEQNGWLQLKNEKGRCVFHNGTQCIIYNFRPEGCVLYPVVYNKDNDCVILDNECPQKHCFSVSKTKEQQIKILVFLLEKERRERMIRMNLQKR